jgi:lysophospholipase L1-like esterase
VTRFIFWLYWALLVGFAALYLVQGVALLSGLPRDYQDAFYLGGFFLAATVLMLSRWQTLRIAGGWLGIFLLLQFLLPPDFSLGARHIHRPPNLIRYVEPRGFMGVEGLQAVSTDHEGFRTSPRVDYARKKPLRIVAIGASTTEEFMLADRATWTHALQQRLVATGAEAEVINAGMAGTRTKHHVETLKYVVGFKPDVAIFLIGNNDWAEGLRRDNFRLLTGEWLRASNALVVRTIRIAGGVRFRPNPPPPESFPKAADGATPDVPREYRNVLTPQAAHGPRVRAQRVPTAVLDTYRAELAELGAICRNGRLRCLLMTQPSAHQIDADPAYVATLQAQFGYPAPPADMIALAQLYNDYLRAFARENDFPLCDLARAMRPSFALFYDSHHFNLAGARRVGEEVHGCVARMLNAR